MSTTSTDSDYLSALAEPQPTHALHALVRKRLETQEREAILGELEALRLELQMAGDEAKEDAVLDVMDALVGWCAPKWRL